MVCARPSDPLNLEPVRQARGKLWAIDPPGL